MWYMQKSKIIKLIPAYWYIKVLILASKCWRQHRFIDTIKKYWYQYRITDICTEAISSIKVQKSALKYWYQHWYIYSNIEVLTSA